MHANIVPQWLSTTHPIRRVILSADATMKRRIDMPRVRHRDTPEYAVDVIEGAKPISSQLAAAAGLLTMLLVAMSAMEAPLTRQDLPNSGTGKMERRPANEPGFLCSIGGKLVSWITVEAA
jgi:hypothetical protein